MSKAWPVFVAALGVAGLVAEGDPPAAAANPVGAQAPNIVIIMADDLSVSTLNDALANNWMPNLANDIIDHGITFANFFVADSLCSPSRATFLTGQHSHNHGVRTNVLPLGGVTVFNDASTLATWLQAAGYRTGLVGKYLNGYGGDTSPSPKDDPSYIPAGWDDWQAITVPDRMYNYALNDNGTVIGYGSQPADYQTDVLAGRAVDFINESESDDGQPFLLVVTPQAPHQETGVLCLLNVGAIAPLPAAPRHSGVTANLPLPRPPSFNEPNVADKPTWIKSNFSVLNAAQIDCLQAGHRNRVGSMLAVDDMIGSIMAALQASDELTTTVVMFVSDNGFLLGEHRINSKQQAYEEAIRMPLYVRGPGIAGSRTAQQLVVNIDIAPTLVELAGAAAGLNMDGRSVVPILEDPNFTPWRNYLLIEHHKSGGILVPPAYSAVRSSQHKWVEYVNGERELYRLSVDPFELVSQHSNPAYKSIRNTLKDRLYTLKTCAGPTCWQ